MSDAVEGTQVSTTIPNAGETEEFDALPVLSDSPRAEALPARGRAAGVIPAVQAAAVAAGGFVAGAAVVGLVHRHQQRAVTLSKGRRAGRRALSRSRGRAGNAPFAGELVQIVGSRSLLLDVHLLGGPGANR